MSWPALRWLVFRLDPERAHRLAHWFLHRVKPGEARRMRAVAPPSLATDVLGLHFDSPVGLAAGFDECAAAHLEPRPDQRMSGHALAGHTGADEQDRAAADGGDRFAGIEEVPDHFDAAREVSQIDRRASAGQRWSWELVKRTSAPARLKPTQVRADDSAVVDAPFLWFSGRDALQPLSTQEIAGLRRFFSLGGILLVDDAGVNDDGAPSAFGRTAREQIAKVLPDTSPIALAPEPRQTT